MMLPSIFGENLLDNWFDDGWNSWDYSNTSLMNTDIKENDNDYELMMNLPGVKKEDVSRGSGQRIHSLLYVCPFRSQMLPAGNPPVYSAALQQPHHHHQGSYLLHP